MTFSTEFWSWIPPTSLKVDEPPSVGQKAPSTPVLRVPAEDGKPTVLTFLRHCGCPFAEKTFLSLCENASSHANIHFIGISHSDRGSTDRWLASLDSSFSSSPLPPNLTLVIDTDRQAYAAWGLGVSSFWHVLGSIPSVSKLDKDHGIKVRSTESGNRWQTGGSFAVDAGGVVRWSRRDERADDMPDFKEGVDAVLGEEGRATKGREFGVAERGE